MKKTIILFCLICCFFDLQGQEADVVRRYDVPEARQGVAVDEEFFYVMNNDNLTKHRKSDGALVKTWWDEDSLLHHLNSGIIRNEQVIVVTQLVD
jgi:hypothetical protein